MTGLFVHRAGRAEASAAALAEVLRTGADADPLQPFSVAVGSRGMERWLRHRLARLLGIVANVRFPFPAALLAEALGLQPQDASWRPEAMTWRVLRWLDADGGASLESDAKAPLLRWLQARSVAGPSVGGAAPGVVDRDRYALARELADILDRVALFRPSWTVAFEGDAVVEGETPPTDPRFAWLRPAWRAVAQGVGLPPARLLDAAETKCGSPLHIFGVVSMPPLWWQAWARVAEVRSVHIFPILPTDAYIGDHRTRAEMRRAQRRGGPRGDGDARVDAVAAEVAAQHPLLTALGRTTRDAVDAYLDAEAHEVDVPDAADDASGSGDAEPAGLLGWVQRDLRDAVGGEELAERCASRRWSADDDSLEVHGCHGPTRQAEVLRDVLLRLFDAHPHLEPRDVLILTPDVGTFAPLVAAAFRQGLDAPRAEGCAQRWGPSGGPRLPLHVADLGVHVLHPLAEVVLTVAEMAATRAKASLALRLAALEPVRTRFGFDDDALARLENWMTETGVRWGADAADRADVAETEEGTFVAGMRRWALGCALADDAGVDWLGTAPWDEAEADADLLGRWAEAWARARVALRAWAEPQRLSAFLATATALVDALTELPEGRLWQRAEFVDTLAAIGAEAAVGARDDADAGDPLLTIDAFRALLERRFQELRAGDRPITGAVTLAALQPMRSVPFRVVVLLGMSDGAFPRAPTVRAFDPLPASPRRGDRDPREEDRHLFLEAVGAAREHLIVLYTSRDPNRDHALPPAPPVADLLDALDVTATPPSASRGAGLRGWVFSQHAAQPYARSAYTGEGKPTSFDGRWAKAAEALSRPRRPVAPFAPLGHALEVLPVPEVVPLDVLASWLVDPARRFVETRTGASTRRYTDALATDVDPVSLDGLESWTFRQRWAAVAQEVGGGAEAGEARYRRMAARGDLLPGRLGHVAWARQEAKLSAWWDAAAPVLAPTPQHALEVRVGARVITAKLGLPGGEWVVAVPDDVDKPRHRLPFHAALHLLVAAGHAPKAAKMVGLTSGGVRVVPYTVPTPEAAVAALQSWLDWLPRAQCAPARVAPKTTASFADAARAVLEAAWMTDEIDAGKVWASARAAWRGAHRAPGERTDPLYQRLFPNGPWADEDDMPVAAFVDDARAIWGPVAEVVP